MPQHRARELYCQLSATDNIVLLKSYRVLKYSAWLQCYNQYVTIRRLSEEYCVFEKQKKKEEIQKRNNKFHKNKSNKLLMEALCQLAIYIDITRKL